jgi:putative membrane protein
VVNGLMTVRVGIAAMRVVRPLPFEARKAPTVRDFLPNLVSTTQPGRGAPKRPPGSNLF